MKPEEVNLIALAAVAKRKGFDNPERLVARLLAIIARGATYVQGREDRRIFNGYNDLVKEDNEALAMAAVILESLQQ